MVRGKVRVKGLDAEFRRVELEPFGPHQRERAETANVPVMDRASVLEDELDGRVRALLLGKVAAIDEERAGEAWLDDEAVAGREVENHELGAPPPARDRGAGRSPRQLARGNLSKNIGFGDANRRDPGAAHLAVEV